MNIEIAKKIVEKLYQSDVREFLVCAGARNAPFVKLLGAGTSSIKVLHFFDERAAAFFALGRVKRDQKPVAIITTSGTAAAELLPATIEAQHSCHAIVLVTADRPISFRGSGAPQAIEQVQLFSKFVSGVFDIENQDQVSRVQISNRSPTHINVCFAEPLIDEEVDSLAFLKSLENKINKNNTHHELAGVESENQPPSNLDAVNSFFSKSKKPLVILSSLSESLRSGVLEFLMNHRWPVYAEATSGLREILIQEGLGLKSGEGLLNLRFFEDHFDSVIRIGGVPTLRFWRDLDEKLKAVPVLSVSEVNYSGLARDKNISLDIPSVLRLRREDFNIAIRDDESDIRAVFEKDNDFFIHVQNMMKTLPDSELNYFKLLSEKIPTGAQVFLGNSLPIREWDMAATHLHKNFNVIANRGANGIDGLISTFLGAARANCENWLILGDLSTLYDLNALAFTKHADSQLLRIVIVNNFGGRIFQPMFKDPNFLNDHRIQFASWAKMFHWDHTNDLSQTLLVQPTIIELLPDATASDLAWRKYQQEIFQ
ncbi:MAG: 2-succinyl-5-enolpyruvyl-6-hydroxy-3-cyclohexene-1-carboxylic-acid synthase [Bdellovibrionales bacterium]